MDAVLAMSFWEWTITVIAVAAYVTGVIWLLFDVLRRPDLSAGKKVLWVVAAFLFTFITLVVYLIFFRGGWDDPLKKD